MTIINGCPCHSRCCTLKNPHCSMAMSAEHRSKFAAFHRQWWRLHMSEKFSSGTKNLKQKKIYTILCIIHAVNTNVQNLFPYNLQCIHVTFILFYHRYTDVTAWHVEITCLQKHDITAIKHTFLTAEKYHLTTKITHFCSEIIL